MSIEEAIKRQKENSEALKKVGTGWYKPVKPQRKNLKTEVKKARIETFNQAILTVKDEIRRMKASGMTEGQLRSIYAVSSKLAILRDAL
jgi:spermidine/putrescine-binding protein